MVLAGINTLTSKSSVAFKRRAHRSKMESKCPTSGRFCRRRPDGYPISDCFMCLAPAKLESPAPEPHFLLGDVVTVSTYRSVRIAWVIVWQNYASTSEAPDCKTADQLKFLVLCQGGFSVSWHASVQTHCCRTKQVSGHSSPKTSVRCRG